MGRGWEVKQEVDTRRLTMNKSQEATGSKDRVLSILIGESSKAFFVADSRKWQLL